MKTKESLTQQEKKFLKDYDRKSLHHFRDILTYFFILDKLTNK